MRQGLRSLAAALAVFTAPAAEAVAAELVVIEARGVTLRPGQTIDDAQPLVLREGQRVTLVAPDGTTIKLRGPYDQPPTASGGGTSTNLVQAMSALLVQKGVRTADVGVVRAGGGDAKLPEPWLIDVSRAGNRCIREGAPVILWRADAGPALPLSVSPLDHSWKLATSWPGGSDRIAMPASFPVQARSTYLIELGDAHAALTLYSIPASVSTDRMRTAWMIEKGCEAQASALLQALR
jgi:hypothetical protein